MPKIKIMLDKAEKWDKVKEIWDTQCQHEGDDYLVEPICFKLKVKASQLDTLMQRLKVEEKCFSCNGKGILYGTPLIGSNTPCEYCSATGTITRDATVEEVREFLIACATMEWHHCKPLPFTLKFGAILKME